MTIKITGLELNKNEIPLYKKGSMTEVENYHVKLEGALNLSVTQNAINASTYYRLDKISKYAKDNLLNALKVIEDELNGIVVDKPNTEELKKQIADLQAQNLKLHQENAELQQDIIGLQLQEFGNKRHETDTNKEVDAVSEALDKVEKVFNVVFNVSEHKTKTTKEMLDEIAKAMRDKGGLF